ncbi:MAG: DUF4340 domain-containing protein [Chloroflexi bacterium]|nr:DUF4340 domain-containing protein [Chloroflexota bacterium]
MARTTIAMAIVFVVLAGGMWAYSRANPPPEVNDQGTATVYVLDVTATDVQRLDVTTADGSTAFQRTEPIGWTFAGSGDSADLSTVNSVVNRLARLRSSAKVLDNATDLSPYGLAPPVVTATLTMKDGAVHRVLVGNETVNQAAYYAIVEGTTQLHTINTILVGDLGKLITEPPVPTPTPETSASPTASPTPQATGTPEPTAGIPVPSGSTE